MNFVPVQGFTLHTYPFAETDKIAQVFTLPWGKVKAVARGVRKAQSKAAPALELLTESVFSLHKKQGGELYILGPCKILDDYHGLKEDFPTITLLQILSDILLQSLPEQQPSEGLYSLLKETLETLRARRESREQCLASFILKILGPLGYPLELEACAECGSILGNRKVFLVPHRGGALCEECYPSKSARWKVSPADLGALKKLKSLSFEKNHVLKLGPQESRRILLTILEYLERTLEKKLPSLEYYRQVV